MAQWGHVMYSDRGLFEVRPSGAIWLMDGKGSARKNCTVILHDAPTEEKDVVHDSGTGRVYAPATARTRIVRSSGAFYGYPRRLSWHWQSPAAP